MRIWPTRRMWKRIGLGLLILLAIAFIANGFMAWWTEHRLQRRIAAIRAAGDPASIADLAPKPIPAEENAAAILNELAPRIDAFAKEQWHFLDKTPLGKAYDKRGDRGEPATPEQLDAVRKILDKYPDIDAGLATMAACDKYASMSDFSVGYPKFLENTLNKPMRTIRDAARFLDWRMESFTAARQPDKAVQQGIELLKLARLYDHEPLMVNMLVAIALRGIAVDPLYDALASGPVSPAMHAALDRELALHDDPQRMVRALKTELGFSIDAIKALPLDAGPQPPAWLFGLIGWPIKLMYIGALNYEEVQIAAFEQASTDGHKKVRRYPALPEPTGYGVLADLMIPATQAAYEADTRCIAMLRALRIFNAMRQFEEKNGREAANLEEIGLPEDATTDPFNGEPLKRKKTKDGWVIYTVMRDGVDDGGDFMGLKDFGVAPPRLRLTSEPEESSDDGETAKDQ